MKAILICTGTELLLGQIVNTNAAYIGKALAEAGIDLYEIVTVGDNQERIANAIRRGSENHDLVIINGGLGPTEDDVSGEALAEVLGKNLVVDPVAQARQLDFMHKRNFAIQEFKDKTVQVIEGAQVLLNGNGSAPGSLCTVADKLYALLPGPPNEMQLMFQQELLPRLRKSFALNSVIKSRVLKVTGIGEGEAESRLGDLIHTLNPTLAPTVKSGEIHFRITAKNSSNNEALKLIDEMEAKFRKLLGEFVFGIDEDNLEDAVAKLLWQKGLTIAAAESCTGGNLAFHLSNVPGSSAYLKLSAITYADEWKTALLGVKKETLLTKGAVSKEVAKQMALGIARKAKSDLGVSITGIAGPEGGSEDKPIGLVYIGIYYQGKVVVTKQLFQGDRAIIRERSTKAALRLLWETLK
ncbi:MAG: competence/damage-inducible protein A [Clostridia bacterium]